MIRGYSIVGKGENFYGFAEDYIYSKIDLYSNIYEINYFNDLYKVKGNCRKFDLIDIYDGHSVISEKFKLFCEINKYKNLEFIQLPLDPMFYLFKVHSIIEFDPIKRGTRFLGQSKKYNGFKEIIGATPVYIKKDIKLEDGFYRTDLFFGSSDRKSPVLLAGEETKKKIIEANLKGFYFEEILY
jgi:hypothetical protein